MTPRSATGYANDLTTPDAARARLPGSPEQDSSESYRPSSVSDGESAIEEVVDATTPIADAAVREAWPAKKVLIAVLPPTLALFSVCVGVWANSIQDREARKVEFEKIRSAEAVAERNRVDEARKAQELTAKERQLRGAELALPRYTDLLTHVHATMKEVAECQKELNPYLRSVFNLQVELDGTPKDLPPGYAEWKPVGESELQSFPVPQNLVVSCREIEPTIESLTLSLDQAQLVTENEKVIDAANALTTALEELSDQAGALLARVTPVAGALDTYEVKTTGDGEYRFGDGWRAEYLLWNLDRQLGEIEPASKLLIEEARGVVLELGE
jgi:hypothetical protein